MSEEKSKEKSKEKLEAKTVVTKSGISAVDDMPYTISVDLKERTIIATVGESQYGIRIRTGEKRKPIFSVMHYRILTVNISTCTQQLLNTGTEILVIESRQKNIKDYLEVHMLLRI